jgi:hypothetical protein
MNMRCKTPHRRIGWKGKLRGRSRVIARMWIGNSWEPDELQIFKNMLLAMLFEAHAKANNSFCRDLRKAILATVTDPHYRAVLLEFFPPTYGGIQ